jgi:hypothetical protein
LGTVNRLSQYFSGVVVKRLTAVEADTARSHQHEFNGVAGMKRILGAEKQTFKAQFEYISDDDSHRASAASSLTWYDARERHPDRSEWRLYVPSNDVYERAAEGDLMVIGRRADNTLTVIVAKGGSTAENQLILLFGYPEHPSGLYSIRDISTDDQELNLATKLVLELIGVELLDTEEQLLDDMLRRWNGTFPSTTEFSSYARAHAPDVSAQDDPDSALLVWIEREEVLFRTLERHIVANRLRTGFHEDVDEFLRFSLSVHNRRKSRAGLALENHLEYVFSSRGILFSRNQITENRARPDFLFPGVTAYHDPTFPDSKLFMLGVKSTCKDRWRQVLSEARRIEIKHLMTLEPGISENQTAEMQASKIQLVLPRVLHATFSTAQQGWLMDLSEFIDLTSGVVH